MRCTFHRSRRYRFARQRAFPLAGSLPAELPDGMSVKPKVIKNYLCGVGIFDADAIDPEADFQGSGDENLP
jgi:hypothetical protein